jgi:ankyrin repeat protein
MDAPPTVDHAQLEAVLRQGAFPDCSDACGHTPLQIAILQNCKGALELLLEAKACANLRPWDRVRIPPLFWAIWLGRHTLLEPLWRAGAEPTCFLDDDGSRCVSAVQFADEVSLAVGGLECAIRLREFKLEGR